MDFFFPPAPAEAFEMLVEVHPRIIWLIFSTAHHLIYNASDINLTTSSRLLK